MAVRSLTRAQFDACFEAPMRLLDDAAHLPEIDRYIDEVVAAESSLQRVGNIHSIYRDAQGRVDQVLLETEQDERYLILLVDVSRSALFGHFLLDMKQEYGIDQ
jgi:hypothetical protein